MKRYWLYFVFLLFCIFNTYANLQDFVFENISIEKGLSNRTVYCITQDDFGFIWFGTANGLNRYDGYNFKVFKHDPNNPNSISNSVINCAYRTKDDVLWFGTNKGLNRYNPLDETFSQPKPENDLTLQLALQRIRVLYEDSNNNLWIGTQNGLFRYDRQLNKIELFLPDKELSNSRLNIIRSIYEDQNGLFWIGTFDGLFKLDLSFKKLTHYRIKDDFTTQIPNNLIMYILQDTEINFLWLGTETGLCKFNKDTGQFEIFTAKDEKSGLSSSAIKNIVYLDENYFLLGTDDGLNLFDKKNQISTPFYHDKLINTSICNNVIWSIFKDTSSGIVWFGTDNGISKMNTQRKQFSVDVISSEKNEIILSGIVVDDTKRVWIGTFNRILCKNLNTNQINEYKLDSEEFSNRDCKSIFIAKDGNIWAGTNNGLLYWNERQKKFSKVIINDNPLLLKYIFAISEDSKGNIWTNINDGLCKIIPEKNASGELTGFSYNTIFVNNENNYSNSEINHIYGDSNYTIWFVVSNEGLFNYDIQTGEIIQFRFLTIDNMSVIFNSIHTIFADKEDIIYVITDKGLYQHSKHSDEFHEVPIDKIYKENLQNGIVDANNNLWLSTFEDLLYYDINSQKTISFNFTHLLNNKGFISNSVYKDSGGIIYLGSYDKFVSFDPNLITSSINDSVVKLPKVTSFQIYDKTINWNRNKGYNEEIIRLKYHQNFIKIYFSLLDFASPLSNQYQYYLEGVDKQWNHTSGHHNYASYSNLLPGDYTFFLAAANPDGFWCSDHVKLKIIILPPWWKTWWAYLIYAFMTIIILVSIFRVLQSRIKLAQQLQRVKQTHEATEEINAIKLSFFTNISHEFRTPLSLILGPLETLIEQIKDYDIQEQLKMMKVNADRLLNLINQIMDFRKIENKKIELNLSSSDIVVFIRSIYELFRTHALSRKIEYSFDSSLEQCFMSFDKDKVEKIVFNLLSNAFKFTPDYGWISISMDRKYRDNMDFFELSVIDTGIGIPQEEHHKIFERFYQMKSKPFETHSVGTGIGLTLCKEFAELHNGSIYVKDNNLTGSVFVVLLPILSDVHTASNNYSEDIQKPLIPNDLDNDKPRLLIVEDNIEMRRYLRKYFQNMYEIDEATNGMEALGSIQRYIPDIIVSDLMMPKIDGLELCEKVKSNMVTSHIPFIILTAKLNEETTREGFLFGADDYITKPFSIKILEIRIANLLEKNKKLREYFRLSFLSDPEDKPVENNNEKFIALLVNTIDKHIDKDDLNIEFICDELKLPHHQIYRKLKAITGQTINEFIRTVRLKRAAQLLLNSDMNISEVMYSVGFSNRSYFSKCFSDEFKMTPKEYKTNQSEANR